MPVNIRGMSIALCTRECNPKIIIAFAPINSTQRDLPIAIAEITIAIEPAVPPMRNHT